MAGKPDFVAADALANVNNVLALPGIAMGNLAWLRANPASALSVLLPENLQLSLGAPLSLARGLLQLVSNATSLSSLLAFNVPTVATSLRGSSGEIS